MIEKNGYVNAVNGIAFGWSNCRDEDSPPDDPVWYLLCVLSKKAIGFKNWSNAKDPKRVGDQVRVGDLMLVLDQIFRDNGGNIPAEVWGARRELEEKILQLTE